jgi:UDP-N-acetylmuramyl pentapeptide phosphotransferase/UDP-N-acetylglucosamine-1-phosphate transferase
MTPFAGWGPAFVFAGAIVLVAAGLCAALVLLIRPWLAAHALARPVGRSSHRIPTPQGGGAAVMAAVLVTAWGGIALAGAAAPNEIRSFLIVTAATVTLAIAGAVDDIRSLAPWPRLGVQALTVGAVVISLPPELQIAPVLPWWVERAGLVVGGLWFVNLVNFMDGIDWMTVAEAVPVAGAIGIAGLTGILPPLPTIVSLALLGAMLGFAPFNSPVAKLFLGDVGSLPIGLLLGWLLIHLAWNASLAAALLLPLYYLADATITLGRRVAAGKTPWEGHRTHFYQVATDRGFSVLEVVGRVFCLNLILAALALATAAYRSPIVAASCLGAGAVMVCWTLARFANGKRVAAAK